MIYGIFHPGSGLGNQLHRYVATRIKALELGVDFSMINPGTFKGSAFMNLDMGQLNHIELYLEQSSGKFTPSMGYLDDLTPPLWEEWNKFTYDPDWNFIEDNTIIDGNFEDPRYFEDYIYQMDQWLKTERLEIPEDVCVIGFRGGEYYTVPELGLPKEYYDRAIAEMLKINPNMKFEVHTDDPELAKQFFPDYPIIKDISLNWRSVRYAKYAIIANSSFYVLPRLLRHHFYIYQSIATTIAPRYWNRYNTKKWDYPQGYYKNFKYI